MPPAQVTVHVPPRTSTCPHPDPRGRRTPPLSASPPASPTPGTRTECPMQPNGSPPGTAAPSTAPRPSQLSSPIHHLSPEMGLGHSSHPDPGWEVRLTQHALNSFFLKAVGGKAERELSTYASVPGNPWDRRKKGAFNCRMTHSEGFFQLQ